MVELYRNDKKMHMYDVYMDDEEGGIWYLDELIRESEHPSPWCTDESWQIRSVRIHVPY